MKAKPNMVSPYTQNCSIPGAIERERYNFERVDSFIYLGLLVTSENSVSENITKCLIAVDRSYFGLKSQFKSQLLSRKTKILMHKTLVRPVLKYISETWTMTRNDERLSIFERKILRGIYSPICEGAEWRKRHNRNLDDLYV
jgi:hypothetical protein